MAETILAIMYDFDKTLSTTDMQNYKFIPSLNMTPEEFWASTGDFSDKYGVERILSYMYMMVVKAKEKGIKLTREFLQDCGKDIEFFKGVESWFDRINKYGESKGVKVEHYLVSSGTKEIVEGCKIYPNFKKAYGCEYLYDDNGEPIWPKFTINFTQKTQFFFRIAKGAIDENDDAGVNAKTKDKLRVPYSNIVYVGDGMTDIACMTLVKKNGGTSIAMYSNDEDRDKVQKIYEDNRVNAICDTDYSEGSKMEGIFHGIIDLIQVRNQFDSKIK